MALAGSAPFVQPDVTTGCALATLDLSSEVEPQWSSWFMSTSEGSKLFKLQEYRTFNVMISM